ncbi:MAG TPA: hypothetical protein ENJ95_08935, partial [Bacteroidetes bacterium]|nr:hypothetical protein [Bacteroidota bacterium]
MPIAQKILLHILLLACPAIIAAQPGLLEICPDSLQGQWEDDFGGWAYCVPDAAPEATFGEVRSLPLRPYSPDSLYFLGHRVQWLYFKLKNCSAVDSLRCFVTFGIDISTAELRYCRGGQCGEWEAAYGGRNLDYENLAFPLNNSAIPIKLGKRDSAAFYLRLHLFQEMSKPMPPVRLVSPGTEERQRKTFNYEKDGFQYFFGFFMGILAVMGLFGFVIYLARKDKAYLFYSLYLLCLFVFYFKIFESYNRSYFHFSLLAKWAANLESSLSIACFIVYLQFARYFLRMDEAGGRFSKWVKYGTLFFCSLFFADLLVQAVYGPASSIKVLKVLVPLILIFCFVFMVDIWRNLPSVLPKIFIASNCFLIAPIFVMRVAELAAVPYDATLWGTMRVFHLGAGDFCFLHTKTGMLLEITGFLIGLAWKTREERLEMMNLAIALR